MSEAHKITESDDAGATVKPREPEQAGLSAKELLESGLVGIWKHRWPDEDSIAVARRLRREAWETREPQ